MNFFAVAFMLLMAVCMFYGQSLYKKKGVEGGKTITIICGVLIIVTALYINLLKSDVDHTAIDREKAYQRAQAIVLSNTLTNMYSGGGKCLVIHNTVSEAHKGEVMKLIESFKEGFGGKVTEMVIKPIKDYPGDEALMEEAMMENTAEDFNKIIKENADCDVVIIMVPLPNSPAELMKMDLFSLVQDPDDEKKWIKDPSRAYPLVGVFNGYIGNLEPFFLDNLVGAMSLWKPDPQIDEKPVPENVKEAFDKRYLIVSPENIIETKQTFPSLFPKARKEPAK